ncbi:MAG: hypothetical protein CM1200mP14_21830 [Gammaproteobacteria bacterium]|nr:MAG: hypothetical protein CM1200mP14_21830 [Gammaproteobacteria bacterium]
MEKEAIEMEGTVSEVLPNTNFRVKLENGTRFSLPFPVKCAGITSECSQAIR